MAKPMENNKVTELYWLIPENIDNGFLINVLKSMGNKHVSLHILPEQYNHGT
jgi:nitric oxide dioxygenase